MLHHKGKFGTSAFYSLDLCMSGISACGYCAQFALQFPIAAYPVFGQEIHGLGGLFQIVQLRPMGEACALLCLDIVLDIKEEEKKGLTVEGLLDKFKVGAGKKLDNDRILLSNE